MENDVDTFLKIKHFISQAPDHYRKLAFLFEIEFEQLGSYLRMSIGRQMVSHALHASCLQGNFEEVFMLVEFAKENCILIQVAPYNLKQLALAENFKIIKVLLEN